MTKAWLHSQVQRILQDLQHKFQAVATEIVSKTECLGSRIDQLEAQIEQLVHHAEVEAAPLAKRGG